jgi:hypothetical protein
MIHVLRLVWSCVRGTCYDSWVNVSMVVCQRDMLCFMGECCGSSRRSDYELKSSKMIVFLKQGGLCRWSSLDTMTCIVEVCT